MKLDILHDENVAQELKLNIKCAQWPKPIGEKAH
jgi:hypothetical protein